MSRLSHYFYAGIVAVGAMVAGTQMASAESIDPRYASPNGMCEDFAGCRNYTPDFSNNRVDRGHVRPRPVVRDRDWGDRSWRGWDESDRRYPRYHNRNHYRSGPSVYLDLYVPGQRYYEPRYVQPRYVPRRVIRLSEAHVQWCYDRYRSYRAYDNTYNPGKKRPRQQCYSPYS